MNPKCHKYLATRAIQVGRNPSHLYLLALWMIDTAGTGVQMGSLFLFSFRFPLEELIQHLKKNGGSNRVQGGKNSRLRSESCDFNGNLMRESRNDVYFRLIFIGPLIEFEENKQPTLYN